ncbi:MAG TPA: hypothetical protein VGR73_04575 [Bryobacteraceae bacterium]|nr:hypothetical protein [Bryobacteraceae bacterium]
MKLVPSGLGAEPRKLAILGALVGVLLIVYFLNRTPDSPAASTAAPSVRPTARTAAPPPPLTAAGRAADSVTPMPPQRAQRGSETAIQDFRPSLKPPEGTDVSRIDPTLHLERIAQLRTLALAGGERSIFDFGPPPKPKELPVVQPIKPVPTVPVPAPIPVAAVPAAPVKPPPPPIPLKFYGYVDPSLGSTRQAFFLEGDDIFVAGENDMVHDRYKILHINPNSAVVEDTSTKSQQTLPLVEELPG